MNSIALKTRLLGENYEDIVIETSVGRYYYSRSNSSLTFPSGVTYTRDNYNVLMQIKNKVVRITMSPPEIQQYWGAASTIIQNGENEIP